MVPYAVPVNAVGKDGLCPGLPPWLLMRTATGDSHGYASEQGSPEAEDDPSSRTWFVVERLGHQSDDEEYAENPNRCSNGRMR